MKAKIVVFDHDPDTLDRVATCLTRRGYHVERCSTPEQVLAAVECEPANIVMLDLAINEITGTEIIRKAKEKNAEVSVIVTGTKEMVDTHPNMLMFAGYECVLKPLNDDVLCAVIEQRLNQQHLYRICSALSATLDSRQVLNMLLETALSEVGADQAVVLLKSESSCALRVEAAKGLSNGCEEAVFEIDETSIVGFVLANHEPVVLQGGFAQLPFIPDKDARLIRSSICAPIRIGGKSLGILNVNRLNHCEPFCQSDLRAVQIIALQTAVSVETTRAHRHALERQRMQQELDLARSIQQNLFPNICGFEHCCEIAAENIPANTVGGDFFDFFELGPERFGLVIGDVAGKGVPGALLMVRAISNFRLRARPDHEPGQVLDQLNNDIVQGSAHGMYVTAVYAIFDFGSRTLSFANAGHPPFLLRCLPCGLHFPKEGGVPLGILRDMSYKTSTLPLCPGDLAFFYTDGLIEARNPDKEEYSLQRLKNMLLEGPATPREFVDHLLAGVSAFTANRPQHDDLTVVAVGVNPAP